MDNLTDGSSFISIKDRIVSLMEREGLSSSRFAEAIGIQRAAMSHIIAGRNNPSLDVVMKIVKSFPHVKMDWLLFGNGDMVTEGNNPTLKSVNPSLFPSIDTDPKQLSQGNRVEKSENALQDVTKQTVIYKEMPSKEVSRIIIYYSDNSFEEFLPHKNKD